MKLFSKKKMPEYELLLSEIEKTKLAMETAYCNFENALEPELIDSYIYELNAAQERYRYLIRRAKYLDGELTTSS